MRAVCRRFSRVWDQRERVRRWGVPALLVAMLLVSGCGRSSFVGRQYDDFTAYYNKFHNAEAAFEENVESIRETDRLIDRTRYLSLFLEPSGASDDAFEPVIQKSADVLREHPNSKWVDDALLMIGRSYYYQENYAGAAQKFREVIDLGDEREGEARFWLARALIANERYDAADDALAGGLGSDETSDRWMAQMRMARGELLARQEQWEAAEQALSQGLEGDLPDRLAARGAFLLGQVRQTLGDMEGARYAYQTVWDYDPRYALAFAARLSDVELQGRYGASDAALDRLQDLEQDDKNYEMRGQMALVRARILIENGQPDAARRVLRTTMYGEDPPSGPSQGRLQYELATLYRDAYEDFSAAAAHFDSVEVEGRRGDGQDEDERRLPTAPTDVKAQADQFRDLAERAREVAHLDSLLRLGRMSEEEFQSFVADLRAQREQQRQNEQTVEEPVTSSQQFGQGGAREAIQRQESAPATQTKESGAGFLFYNDPSRVQQGRRQFRQTWGSRPRADHWRRQTAIRQGRTAEATTDEEAEAAGAQAVGATAGEEQAPGAAIDLSAVPRDSSSQAQMEDERAVARYELANALFLTAQRPDSAATWYQRIVQRRGGHPMADRARYGLAEVRRAQGDTAAARAAYRHVIEADPNSSLAARARKRLGQSADGTDERTEPQADTAYARAYNTWQSGRPDSALVRMLDLTHRYPETPAAPRALLASSIIYWHQVQDGASVSPLDSLARHLPALDSVEINRSTPGAEPDTTGAGRVPSESRSARRSGADTTRAPAPSADTTVASDVQPGRADLLTSADVPQDSTEEAEQQGTSGTADPTQEHMRRPIQILARPWMVVFSSLEPDTLAQQSIRQYRNRWANVHSTVHLCRGNDRLRIGLGAFASKEEAQAVRVTWADRLPDEVWIHQCDGSATTLQLANTRSRNSATPPSPSLRGGERYAPLEAMLTYLTRRYPNAPQAARAESIMEIVQDRRREADSLTAVAASNRERRANPRSDTTQVSPQTPRSAPKATSSRSVAPRSEGASADTATAPRRSPSPDTTETDSSGVAPQSRWDHE